MQNNPPLLNAPPSRGDVHVFFKNLYATSVGDTLAERLVAAGLALTRKEHEEAVYVLILIGESSSPEAVCTFLQRCAQAGRRVLCLTHFNRPLEPYRLWELLQMGAEDVLEWEETSVWVEDIIARFQRWTLIENLLNASMVKESLVGQSFCWRKTLRNCIEIAVFSNAPVLLQGESGTGKELLARLIHSLDEKRRNGLMMTVDCTTLTPELAGSELFGHDKGAFTHAISNRDGAIALADKGVLFLDEIGELSPVLQAELLRSVQERMYKRVGSDFWRSSDFRLIAATNRRLSEEVKHGRFREDLFYRLSACVCLVPPLRDRREDIPLLAEFFARRLLKNLPSPCFDKAVMRYLCTRDYPGNVRELQQLIARMAYRHAGNGPISIGDIPELDRPVFDLQTLPWNEPGLERAIRLAIMQGYGLKEIKRQVSNRAMDIAIAEADGCLQDAAYALQVSDRTIQMYQASLREGTYPDAASA